jgi:PAS domain S-box-containing protein
MANVVGQLLDIPSTDPDDARRRKLLNILLVGMAVMVLLGLLVTIGVSLFGALNDPGITSIYPSGIVLLTGFFAIYIINRRWSGLLASSLFLLLLTLIFALTDEPKQVADGRSLLMFAIPILMASVLLRPSASFIMAALSGLLVSVIALNAQLVPNVIGILAFFIFAMISWLSARSLEQALTELRAINRELDQRVEERTRDLAAALSREQAEANKNQAILEGIADGVIVFDHTGTAIVANPAIGRLLEQPFDEITGCDIETLMGADVETDDREMIVNVLRDNELNHSSAKFEWGEKTLSVSFAPVLGSAGAATGTVAVFRDYTREAEVDRMKSAFVSMVSHDLRTPLSVILGYADVLREAIYGPLTEKQLNVMRRITANARRLLSLVNNLLDQAQIEAGKLRLNITSFTPNELLEDVDSVTGLLAQNKGLALTYEVGKDMPETLAGDRQRLSQILINLVNNAVKFTEEGTIGVRVYRQDTDCWAMDVSDTGPGIPTAVQSQVFDPFWQLDNSVTREHPGVGLGLAIVKQLIDLMGGEVKLVSKMGRGSTLTVILPLTPVQEEES